MAASQPTGKSGPLAGVRVLDLTSVVLGPYATQMLGDLGADVIKIEPPEGDTTRYTGPRVSRDMASLFMGVNRNKRSIVLDLKTAPAREALLRLVDRADVFVHNIRPQKLEPLGLGSDTLRKRNPRLIYAGIHGWREDGPYSGRPAYDDIIQGLCGVASLMDQLTGEPRYAPTILCDKTSGLVAAQAILAALYYREKTGRGQFIEIPMFETMVAFIMVEHLHGLGFNPPQGEPGYARVLAPWRRPYRTADGYLCMLAYTDAQWRRFWAEVGKPEMTADPRFADMAARSRSIDEVYRLAGEELTSRKTADWIETFDTLEIPAGPVKTLTEVIDDPHLAKIGFFKHMQHPTEGELVMPDVPVQFAGSPAAIHRLPPRLGEHGREILQEIGMGADEIEALAAGGGVVLPGGKEKVA
ncbi:MAG: CoA transferase [Xanthobacteraceae bacterium]|nr:CoA transferase [Xanthobacteraceae bacterium]